MRERGRCVIFWFYNFFCFVKLRATILLRSIRDRSSWRREKGENTSFKNVRIAILCFHGGINFRRIEVRSNLCNLAINRDGSRCYQIVRIPIEPNQFVRSYSERGISRIRFAVSSSSTKFDSTGYEFHFARGFRAGLAHMTQLTEYVTFYCTAALVHWLQNSS